LARRHQLNWRPAHVLQNLTLTRASQLIDMTEIQVAVELALQEQFPQSLLTVMLDRSVAPMHLPVEATPSLSIQNFAYDANSMRFNARVVAAEGTPHEARQNVTGRFTRMVEIPVAVTRLPQGHLISQQDLTWLAIPENNVNRGIVENITQLVGMEVRRALSENAPIRTSDVMEPELIRKGDMVVMEVTTPFMSLTAQGRALDTGRLHGMVRVQNLTSRQIVQGIVVERGRVQVSVPFLRPLQQTALPSNPSIRSR
jgi:flagella basal body P-ring formation protein FlgA